MIPKIDSLWIILTVMIPGIIFYGLFRVIITIYSISIPLFNYNEVSIISEVILVFSLMFLLQIIGIVLESIAFKLGPYIYKHKDEKKQQMRQEAFRNKYIIQTYLEGGQSVHVERVLGQFFLSHNITVGILIIFLFATGCTIYLVISGVSSGKIITFIVSIIVLGLLLICAFYVAYNRFRQSCQVLGCIWPKIKKKIGDEILLD